ncbi:MAG: 2-oxoglutarate dehydrogenase complex dihydrolipoyllysine-residue succinyltransferase [Ktedonobacterales bacterium]
MSVEIRVPQLGESIVEATIGQWLKHEGETVTADEPVVELETEKVNMEVIAPAAGVLHIAKNEGDTIGIGDVLATIDDTPVGQQPAATAAPAPDTAPAPAPALNGASASNGTHAIHAEEQDDGTRVTPLARRIASEHSVDLRQIRGTGANGRITQDDVTAYLNTTAAPAAAAQPYAAAQAQPPQGTMPRPATASPAPQTLVTPPPPTITQRPPAPPAAPGTRAPAPTLLPAMPVTLNVPEQRREERVRMSRRRQTIARRLVEAQQTAAMLTTFNEVDMSAVMELRKRHRDTFKDRYGVSLGFMSFFTRAVVGALKAYPRLNAEIQGDEMVLKHYYDIGIAVGASEGLVVPVVRDADRLTFAQIEQQIATLAAKARDNQLTLDELQGGTFTITNGGTFGSLLSTPILNAPQVGILGMHKIEERPIALNGQVVIHPMMYLALSYDHRIVDGSEAVSFLVRVKQLLEDPEALLLEA